ncbi:MAG TPA: sensor domain-containing diguanylate cyclase [Anaeromyxobacter sp.]
MRRRSTRSALDPAWVPISLSSLETLRELVHNLREGVYITTSEGEVLDANPAMLELFGVRSIRELEGRRVHEWIDPLRREREHAILERRGVVRDFEFAFRGPGGEVRTVIDTAFMRRDRETGKRLYFGILIDITERKRLERQLVETGLRDPLTGCFNRRYLRRFEAGCAARGWGCIAIDVDHFKAYNDQYGHERGDRVLVRMARFLGGLCRSEDAVVRLGGDEFMILLAGMRPSGISRVARRLAGAAREKGPVPFSLGWASRWRGERLQGTMARADRRLIAVRVASRAEPPDDRRAEQDGALAGRRGRRRAPGQPGAAGAPPLRARRPPAAPRS